MNSSNTGIQPTPDCYSYRMPSMDRNTAYGMDEASG